MQRLRTSVRPDWQAKVESQGLYWHTGADGRAYWDESAYWRFSTAEIDRIEAATRELYDMCLAAVGQVIERRGLADFGYDAATIALIEASWANRSFEPTFYARFDLAYDGRALKLLELNGDTPTSLVEASVIQWWWLEDKFPGADQFNSIHDRLVEALTLYRDTKGDPSPLYMTCVAPNAEDEGTLEYLAACASDAGLDAAFIALADIGWREGDGAGRFVDLDDAPIGALFKLVPWEWLLADPFGAHLAEDALGRRIQLIEPAWKMVASNKRLLVTLKAMFPDSEWLLDATMSADEAVAYGDYVKKPVLGREGANVAIVSDGQRVARSDGAYDDDAFVYQRKAALAQADGVYAVIGSWVVNRTACGLGVRESASPITNNLARFVPHIMQD